MRLPAAVYETVRIRNHQWMQQVFENITSRTMQWPAELYQELSEMERSIIDELLTLDARVRSMMI